MSTFVVRFVDSKTGACRGRVCHVRSGEETTFGSARELLAFFHAMNAVGSAALEAAGTESAPSLPEDARHAERAGGLFTAAPGNPIPADPPENRTRRPADHKEKER